MKLRCAEMMQYPSQHASLMNKYDINITLKQTNV